MKKYILLILLTLLSTTFLSAQSADLPDVPNASGNPETELPVSEKDEGFLNKYFPVDGLNQWEFTQDISELEEGTYNIVVRGEDAAGNVIEAEAVDIEIDSRSDLPYAAISYPSENISIRGNVNILGSAGDDDGVSYVEVRLGDGTYNRAEGTEFWSYPLETETLPDGEYTITARSIDINGLPGNERSLKFHLDKKSPRIDLESHNNGSFVGGKIELSGYVEDRNGIKSISYSLNSDEEFEEVKQKGKDKEGPVSFSFGLDTRDFPDGALTVNIKAVDEQQSSGLASFLLYVDNTPPALEVFYPTPEDVVTGTFSVMGRVADDVGVQTLSYTLKGSEPQDIPLVPGNPFWSVNLDIPDEKQANVEFTITDIAGNNEVVQFKHDIDRDADIPVLIMSSPEEGLETVQSILSGWVSDNSIAGGISYSIDNSEEVRLESGRAFNLLLEDLNAGEHSIQIRSFDKAGIESEILKIPFTLLSKDPVLKLTRYRLKDKTTAEYTAGREFQVDALPGIDGVVTFDSGSGSATYRLPDGSEEALRMKKGTNPGEYSFQLDLKGIDAAGYFPIEILALDEFGGEARAVAALWLKNLTGDSGKDGLFPLMTGTEEKPSHFRFTDEMQFLFHGGTLSEVELINGSDELSVSHKLGVITLKADGPAVLENLSIRAQSREGKSLEYGPFSVTTDLIPPDMQISEPSNGDYVQDFANLEGTVKDNLIINSLDFSIQSGDFKAFDVVSRDGTTLNPNNWPFTVNIPLEGTPDGPVRIRIRSVDSAANESFSEVLLIKDTKPPELRQVLPEATEPVNGLISLLYHIEDEWSEGFEAELILNEETRPLEIKGNSLVFPLDLAPYETLPENLAIRIRDDAGNQKDFIPRLAFDSSTDKPEVQIHVPLEDTLIKEDSFFSGIVLDDDGVEKIEYRIDEGEFIALPGGNSFEIPIKINSLTDNLHTLEMRAYDLGGVESDTTSVTFRVSLEVPVAEMVTPALGTTNKGRFTISGTASDANGIEAVYLSFDNGNIFHKTTGRDEWTYPLDSSIIIDGNHMVLIKVLDSYGVEGIYSNLLTIDNTAPHIELSSPRDGSAVLEEIFLQMRITDELSVKSINYAIAPLEESSAGEAPDQEIKELPQASLTGTLEVKEVVLANMDLSSLSPGRYNLSVFAYDDALNEVMVSRNIFKLDPTVEPTPEILFPLPGTEQHGSFNIEGRISGTEKIERVTVIVNGLPQTVVEASPNRFFSLPLAAGELAGGHYTLQAEVTLKNGNTVRGDELEFDYEPEGAWVRIESVSTGDFVNNRPWIEGRTAYPVPADPQGEKPSKQELKSREVVRMEYSLDNGKRFEEFKAREEWKFRLETQELQDGPLGILVRATFRDNQVAIDKVFVQVDETPPDLSVITPKENMAFNDLVAVSGTAFDENGLSDISVMFRDGSKTSHELPQFIQGLYLDAHLIGGTSWELGVGLTFFDDNVRLQALIGHAPEGRFNGSVFGLKLLANVATFPYGYYFGPDWDFLSSSIAVGSAFEYFTMTESNVEQNGLILGAMIAQLELVKVELDHLDYFNTYSFYVENQFWFISSDVEGGLEYRIAFGIRVNVF